MATTTTSQRSVVPKYRIEWRVRPRYRRQSSQLGADLNWTLFDGQSRRLSARMAREMIAWLPQSDYALARRLGKRPVRLMEFRMVPL